MCNMKEEKTPIYLKQNILFPGKSVEKMVMINVSLL